MRKVLAAAVAACTLGFASQAAFAVECFDVRSIGAWDEAGSCTSGDKTWTLNSTDLGAPITLLFLNPDPTSNSLVISGFDTTNAPGMWHINYTITVNDPTNFFISSMFAETINPDGGSNLTKNVTGDETFTLIVNNGSPDAGSSKSGLDAITLTVDETFSVLGSRELDAVGDLFHQSPRNVVPEPGTLTLLGLGLLAAGAVRRRRS